MTTLEIDTLRVSLLVEGEQRPILRNVSLRIEEGEAHSLVGESGSGKSMTARAVMRILPPRAELSGRIEFEGRSIPKMNDEELRRFRSEHIGLIYQDPRARINPVRRIGDFLTESLRTTRRVPPAEAEKRVLAVLEDVLVDDPERRMRQYPHELSGGLLQRIMIAAALAAEPRLLIADEPTTGLDVSTQAEVVAILDEQRRERGLSVLFITHNLDLAGAVCDRISVMYAGTIVETQAADSMLTRPRHPYTAALLGARPSLEAGAERLAAIPGRPIASFEAPPGCPFTDRCSFAEPRCRDAQTPPPLTANGQGSDACVRSEELAAALIHQPQGTVSG